MSLAAARQQFPHLRDYSDQELLGIVAQSNGIESGTPQYKKLESELLGYDRTWGQVAKDVPVQLGQGLAGIGQTIGSVAFGVMSGGREPTWNNPMTTSFKGLADNLEQYKSQGLRNRAAGAEVEAGIAEREAEAGGAGAVGQFVAGAGSSLAGYGSNPQLLAQDLTTNLPQLLVGGPIGRATGKGLQVLGAGTKVVQRGTVAGAVGAGSVMQGTDVGEETFQRLIAAGASPEEAAAGAMEAAGKAGAATIATSMLPGGTSIERSLVGQGSRNIAGRSIARRGLATVGEGVSEGAEEGYGQFAGNQAVAEVDPTTNLMGGVGRAAGQGAAVGGLMGGALSRAEAPRTATGEIDLTGTPTAPAGPATGPNPLDIPAYQRQGLDPLNERSSPFTPTPPAPPAGPATEGTGVMTVTPDGQVIPPMTPEQQLGMDASRAQAQQEIAARRAAGTAAAAGTVTQGNGVMLAAPDGTILPPQTPEQLQETERARQVLESRPPAAPEPDAAVAPNRGQLLKTLAAANTELGKTAVKKDGELSNTRGTAPLRAVLEAPEPLSAMRELHDGGNAPRDELLDTWHKNLTGKTIFEWKAEQQPADELNSAGFVPEPAAQVQAQVDAVRDGRKPTAVIGEQEAVTAELNGLATGVATGPDGAKAVVVSKDPAAVTQAIARSKEVGLKVAMGETLGVANPTITSQTEAPAAVAAVQQVDDATGQVIAEELVTPADLQNVTPVAGTTPRLVPVGQPVADRKAAMPAAAQAAISAGKPKAAPAPKKAKAPKYGRHPTAQLVEIAENTKDEAEYTEARFELFKRWANDTDDGASEAYLSDKANKSELSKEESESFKARHKAEQEAAETKRGQKLGKKFGVDDGSITKLGSGIAQSLSNPDNGTNPLSEADVAGITDGKSAVDWLMANAKDPWHRDVAARIAPFVGTNVSVKFVKAGDDVPARVAAHLDAHAMAVARLSTDGSLDIFYRTDKSLNEAMLLHELIHAATMRALQGKHNIAMRNEMRKLLRMVKLSFKDITYKPAVDQDQREAAGFMEKVLIDENELLAYAFSSPTMRRWMQNMNANGLFIPFEKTPSELERQAERRVPGVPPVTMWQRFTDLIRKLFNIPPKHQIAFEQMLADRADEISGLIEAGKDTSLYLRLDEFLDAAMEAQAAQLAPATESVSAGMESTLTKPFGAAAKAVTASVKAQTSGKEISGKLLSVMTLRQIDEQFGKRLPALRDWIGAIMERGSNASKLAAEADRVALQWEQSVKDPAERKALADVLLRASMAELQLDNTDPTYLASLDAGQRVEHAALNQKLAGMSAEARRTRTQALAILRKQWEYTRTSLETFINHTVPDPGLRNQRIEDLKTEMGRNRGDYFPLSRFGDRIVIGRAAAKDGRDVVSFHESAASADAEVKRLKDSGVKKIDVTLQTNRDSRQRASTGFMGSLHQMIDTSGADGAIKDSMHDALQQLYLKSLPELSGAKHMIRRENVEGFSHDAMRVFADAVTRGARYASHLEYGPAIQAAMEAAEAQSRSSDKRSAAVVIGRKDGSAPVVRVVPAGTDRLNAVNSLTEQGYTTEFFNTVPESAGERMAGALEGATKDQLDGYVAEVEQVVGRTEEGVEDMRAAKALYNHMIDLQKTEGNQDPSKAVEALGQLGYTWYLGFSPAFWAMNTLQNPMIGIPHLGAKYGVGKAAGEWMGAARWFGAVRMGKLMKDGKTPFSVDWIKEAVKSGQLKGITKQELDMLQDLEDRQVLDFTQAMDLSRIGQAAGDKRYKFLRWAAAGAHHTEVFNRVTFALAAYRLALKSDAGVTHEQAVRRAENDTAAVHFDYSYANKPEVMRGKQVRLLFMFQQYRQHMLYWWANNIKDMVKNEAPGDRSRALKAALLMGTTNLVFAGATGLPFVGAVALIANLLGSDDDDGVPFDFNRWITEAAVEATGSKEAGEVMAKGIFSAIGLNIGQRIGQADLLPLLNAGSAKYERNADDKTRAYLFDLLGPLASITLGAAKATEAFARGDILGGLANTTPKAAADILKAYQLETEGMKNNRGQILATAESFDGADVFMQAAGVTPTRVANLKADRGRIMDVDTALRDTTTRITSAFTEAWMRGDRQGIAEAVEEVKAFNAKIAGGKLADPSLLINGQKLEMAIKDRQNRAMLLALTGGTAETKRQLLLATRMSGLFNPVTMESMQQNAAGGLPGLPGLPGQ